MSKKTSMAKARIFRLALFAGLLLFVAPALAFGGSEIPKPNLLGLPPCSTDVAARKSDCWLASSTIPLDLRLRLSAIVNGGDTNSLESLPIRTAEEAWAVLINAAGPKLPMISATNEVFSEIEVTADEADIDALGSETKPQVKALHSVEVADRPVADSGSQSAPSLKADQTSCPDSQGVKSQQAVRPNNAKYWGKSAFALIGSGQNLVAANLSTLNGKQVLVFRSQICRYSFGGSAMHKREDLTNGSFKFFEHRSGSGSSAPTL
jgi:hypothetical protein